MRAFRLLAALLQLSLPSVAALADARLDSGGAHAVAHIESHTTNACTRIHPPDCALCHFLTAPLAVRRPAAFRFDRAADHRTRPAEPAVLRSAVARSHTQARAPPPLS